MSRHEPKLKNILLDVAGYDPSAGAGVALDLMVFRTHGYHGMAIITSLTSQNTKKIKKIHCPPSRFLLEQYRTLREDVEFSGIKIGMIGCKDHISAIGKILDDSAELPIVIDPVFKSSDGTWLLDKKAIPDYIAEISGKVSLLTPNISEAELISGMKVAGVKEMSASAEKIFVQTSIPCLIKGGHLPDKNIDILFDGKDIFRFENEKLELSVHGTGCFLSSSILCYLANGLPLDKAASRGIQETHKAIKGALKLGKGQYLFGDIL
jgi:hydroxymethylpyrimidine/phosphomethylpyrimidine kinase